MPRADGRRSLLEVLAGRHQAGDLGIHDVAAMRDFEIAQNFGKAEHAHGDDDEADAVSKFRDVEVHTARAGFKIGADHRQHETEQDHA